MKHNGTPCAQCLKQSNADAIASPLLRSIKRRPVCSKPGEIIHRMNTGAVAHRQFLRQSVGG